MRPSLYLRNRLLEQFAREADGGWLRIYSEVETKDISAPAPGQLIAELRIGAPGFVPPLAGALTARPLIPENSARVKARAKSFRVYAPDGKTVLWDGSVGEKKSKQFFDLKMERVDVDRESKVTIDDLVVLFPET